jgi:hypothetical protein
LDPVRTALPAVCRTPPRRLPPLPVKPLVAPLVVPVAVVTIDPEPAVLPPSGVPVRPSPELDPV